MGSGVFEERVGFGDLIFWQMGKQILGKWIFGRCFWGEWVEGSWFLVGLIFGVIDEKVVVQVWVGVVGGSVNILESVIVESKRVDFGSS